MKKILVILIAVLTIVLLISCASQKAVKKTETADELYARMSELRDEQTLILKSFPNVLEPMLSLSQGDIFQVGDTVLQLVWSSQDKVNKPNYYPFYFLRDNCGNYWTFFKSWGDVYRLYKENSKSARSFFREEQEKLDSKKSVGSM